MLESFGIDPQDVLNKEAMTKPWRTVMDSRVQETEQLTLLYQSLKKAIIKEIMENVEIQGGTMVAREKPPPRY